MYYLRYTHTELTFRWNIPRSNIAMGNGHCATLKPKITDQLRNDLNEREQIAVEFDYGYLK